ncbi:hypothetical protein [Desmonostoc muscorum]|uniref:hypothetical protein n=1 Tax=Desmonostoc muscorum TaxID=1179 RepID=UPI001F1A69DB|nr:hypothetical protein [Desmonostoc muscorum]
MSLTTTTQKPLLAQYCLVKATDAINRRQDEGMIIVETAIYRVFGILNFNQKTLTEPY